MEEFHRKEEELTFIKMADQPRCAGHAYGRYGYLFHLPKQSSSKFQLVLWENLLTHKW